MHRAIQIDQLHLKVKGVPARTVREALDGLGPMLLRQLEAEASNPDGMGTLSKGESGSRSGPPVRVPVGTTAATLRTHLAAGIARSITNPPAKD